MADWAPNTYYFYRSVITYNGFSYISTKFHLSGSSFLDDWKVGIWSYYIVSESSSGMAVWGENRELFAITPLMDSVFYKDSLIRSTSSTIPSITDFQTQYAITSPAGNYNFTFSSSGGNFTSSTTMSFSLSGYVNMEGTNYYSPDITPTRVGSFPGEPGPSYNRLDAPPVLIPKSTNIKQFGKSTSSPTYGISFKGIDDIANAIDQDYQSFYIHPKSDGSIIRTGTATSFPSSFNTVYGRSGAGTNNIAAGSLVNTLTQNITFDQAYDNPPLIFLTDQNPAPIALAGFITNSDGKYIGAAVVPPSGFGTSPELYGYDVKPIETLYSPRVQLTSTFEYFIVSNEESINALSNNYGIKIYQEDGVTEAYSSKNQTLTILENEIEKPYMYWLSENGTSYFANSEYGFDFSRTAGRAPLIGICLNNCLAVCGLMRGVSSVNGYYSGDDALWNAYGPVTILGRYASITKNEDGSITSLIGGFGTNSFLVGFGHVGRANIGTSLNLSWDFHIGNESKMKQLVAIYDYGIGPY